MVGGFLFTTGMIRMRLRFFWWRFHPLEYIMATNGEMSDPRMVFIICYLLKWLALKFGGIQAHRRARPFFLELILGDYTMGSLWNILSIVLNTTIYQFYP